MWYFSASFCTTNKWLLGNVSHDEDSISIPHRNNFMYVDLILWAGNNSRWIIDFPILHFMNEPTTFIWRKKSSITVEIQDELKRNLNTKSSLKWSTFEQLLWNTKWKNREKFKNTSVFSWYIPIQYRENLWDSLLFSSNVAASSRVILSLSCQCKNSSQD